MKIISNGSKWHGEAPDTVETLINVLKRETLDPCFDFPEFGRFFYKEGNNFAAFGNFLTVSHVFNIHGTAEEMEPLRIAIKEAKNKPEYVVALAEYKKDLAKKDMLNIPVRTCSISCKTNPEWGTFGVFEDRGAYYEIGNSGGRRILDKSEAVKFWEVK